MRTATDIAALDDRLNDQIRSGKLLDAFEEFYADDVVMQENSDPQVEGKDANRTRELAFVESVETFHSATLRSTAVGDDVSMSEWTFDITFKGADQPVQLEQVSVRRWRDDQIVAERFYYNAA